MTPAGGGDAWDLTADDAAAGLEVPAAGEVGCEAAGAVMVMKTVSVTVTTGPAYDLEA